jgi:hypothetical protein
MDEKGGALAGLKWLRFFSRGTELRVAREPYDDRVQVDMEDERWVGSISLNIEDMRELRDVLTGNIEQIERAWESRERIRKTASEVVVPKPEPEQPDGLPES